MKRLLKISKKSALLPHVIKTLDFGPQSEISSCIVAIHMHAMSQNFRLGGIPVTARTVAYATYGAFAVFTYIYTNRQNLKF